MPLSTTFQFLSNIKYAFNRNMEFLSITIDEWMFWLDTTYSVTYRTILNVKTLFVKNK